MHPSRFAPLAAVAVLAGAGGAAIALGTVPGAQAPTSTAAGPQSSRHLVADRNSSATRIYGDAKDSVAYVQAQVAQGTSTGTGFVISGDGLIVTNQHVVDGATQVAVKLGTGGQARAAQVVGTDPSTDLALLKVDATGLKALELGDSSQVGVGDAVYAIGNPFGLDHTLTSGIVSAVGRDIQAPDGQTITGAIQTDAALNPGNSGGPLLDGDGKVIGVNSQIATGSQSGGEGGNVGIGFAVPANTVKRVVAEIKAGGGQDGQSTPSGGAQPEQSDPYAQPEQSDPYAQPEQSDPYAQPEQSDPYGDPETSPGQDIPVPEYALPLIG